MIPRLCPLSLLFCAYDYILFSLPTLAPHIFPLPQLCHSIPPFLVYAVHYLSPQSSAHITPLLLPNTSAPLSFSVLSTLCTIFSSSQSSHHISPPSMLLLISITLCYRSYGRTRWFQLCLSSWLQVSNSRHIIMANNYNLYFQHHFCKQDEYLISKCNIKTIIMYTFIITYSILYLH